MAASAIKGLDSGAARWRFVAAICLGSFLLFLVQPMIARMALPRLGGAPAVWNSAMLVYQGLLLVGYAYAHALGKLAPRRQAGVHLALFGLAALTLPIGLSAAVPSAEANPIVWVPWLLLVSIGPLFFVISAQAPLLQRWFALTGAQDPYPLYAASNLGSFGGLLAYPLLVEPLLPLDQQRWLWSIGFILLATAVAWCAVALPRSARASADNAGHAPAAASPGRRAILHWILLSAIPSGLILSTTLHLTTDIGAVPLLWVLPLGVYLLSFTVAFAARRRAVRLIAAIAPVTLLLAAIGPFFHNRTLGLAFGAVAVVNLFTVSVALHGQLFDRRPDARHLTLFYLCLSIGGFLGGTFCALVAPLIFDWTYEHLLLLLAAAWLLKSPGPFGALARRWRGPPIERWLPWVGVAALALILVWTKGLSGLAPPDNPTAVALFVFATIGLLSIGRRLLFTACVAAAMIAAGGWEKLLWSAEPGKMTRSYFGVYTVRPHDGEARALVHGTTVHGVQNLGSPERERMTTAYFSPPSGVGLALVAAAPDARISVVGLGAGTLACYARPDQRWTFFEIDPAVVAIAEDPSRFTFLSGCLPNRSTVVGDARLTLARAEPGRADILVIDAFTSDAIPIHLLTREAFQAYRRHLKPDGLLMVHISNRFLRLEPLVGALARDGNWHGRLRVFHPTRRQLALNYTPSVWVALSPVEARVRNLDAANPSGWMAVPTDPDVAPWTDDYATILPVIRWN